ncbi:MULTISPECIES: DUF3349 domain-containing protein [unclassified Gordonia (in: high G+C Gram-positive bacteria)]|uniref:DUF3349 domain-containing protein n=1 Tax=unclassified Gordonia (in: high G+C Gram-positive bacteria) TaxID=2657482 RepID=UPI001FFE6642|nr:MULTISPECIES: DUF3349 domain-containing protein [unclassified Gordonia (in: high G+C Gram-positive bacteria)]UQE74581.1 DUF3349 domain-containing protein [Gordonia sp. PP30]
MPEISSKLSSVVAWLRKGYPNGVPEHDYVPLFALLRRQLTVDEISDVAARLSVDASSDDTIDRIDTGVAISRITDEVPRDEDIARVRTTLETAGWPFDDAPLAQPLHPGAASDAPDPKDEP